MFGRYARHLYERDSVLNDKALPVPNLNYITGCILYNMNTYNIDIEQAIDRLQHEPKASNEWRRYCYIAFDNYLKCAITAYNKRMKQKKHLDNSTN